MSNYIFQNEGDYTFTNRTKEWGLDKPSFANGSAYVDLDNDGDLDIVTSNYNEPAMVYENILNNGEEVSENSYLRIRIKSESARQLGLKAYLFFGSEMKYADHSNFCGYRSTVDPVIHFGLGNHEMIDSLLIIWPDGMRQTAKNIRTDQTLEIVYNPESKAVFPLLPLPDTSKYLFRKLGAKSGLSFKHQEAVFDDFQLQETLPHQLSNEGPALAVGDINGDKQEDLVVGGSLHQPMVLFIQNNGQFERREIGLEGNPIECTDIVLFDADSDGDLDLYLVHGSQEAGLDPGYYQDRLYLNDGLGNFLWQMDALPPIPVSGSCVKPNDFDEDGDIDLFVGGGLVPGAYPKNVSSFLLRNVTESGVVKFADVTAEICPELIELGMVRDALWTDFDDDNQTDLVLVGEWMPVTFFINQNGIYTNVTEDSGIKAFAGWWRSIVSADFDNDGDKDFVVGNEGLNSWFKASQVEPVSAYHTDFNNDGRYDVIITQFLLSKDGTRKEYPVHFRSDLGKQLEMMNKKFTSYAQYSGATIEDMFSVKELENAGKLQATWMANSYIENLGNGQFTISKLPTRAQWAPINAMIPQDFNKDGNLDLLIVGNHFSNSVFWGPIDALNGLVMLGDGQGSFSCSDYPETGFYVPGDARALVQLSLADGQQLFIASQNQDSLKVFLGTSQ
jgi:hypothetical protein